MSNSIDLYEMAYNALSHLDLCCLQKPIIIAFGSERVNGEIRKLSILVFGDKSALSKPVVPPAILISCGFQDVC